MKKNLIFALLLIPATAWNQNASDCNVISYYAVGNSLDGQPMIDMPNLLRFFPVYALVEDVDSVQVTIFYGGKIYSRHADPSVAKKYWEVLLPKFKLGDAIQRLEVEVRLKLPDKYRFQLVIFDSEQAAFPKKIEKEIALKEGMKKLLYDRQIQVVEKLKGELGATAKNQFKDAMDASNRSFLSLGINSNQADGMRIRKENDDSTGYRQIRYAALAKTFAGGKESDSLAAAYRLAISRLDTVFRSFGITSPIAEALRARLTSKDTSGYAQLRDTSLVSRGGVDTQAIRKIDSLVFVRDTIITNYQRTYLAMEQAYVLPLIPKVDSLVDVRTKTVSSFQLNHMQIENEKQRLMAEIKITEARWAITIDSLRDVQRALPLRRAAFRDSLKKVLAKEIELDLIDTLYTGLSVRRSDVIVDDSFERGRILYRNYKSSLRYMAALDPAEKMGIFRVRYVPFPIVGTRSSPRMNLLKPMTTTSPTVFEFGLAFGNAIVPGDDFVVPQFSWQRLGFAFAITERLFDDDADILALALTYDFNSYASIGLGGNFAHKEVHGYMSLGINKKAFEAAVAGLASVFGI